MCGIAGYVGTASGWGSAPAATLTRMCEAIAYRGPDDSGAWIDENARVALGHRRLAIVDLSQHGHQPMACASGRFVIVFNGEIYNHQQLREALPGHCWRSHSDTETLIELIARFGLHEALRRCVGMFAFALWDREARTLSLARDRMGEKPLYYGRLPSGEFVFASELKALRAHPRWQGRIDRNALTLLLRHNCIPAPWSIYEGIRKLRPASWLTLRADGSVEEGEYWSALQAALDGGAARNRPLSDREAADKLEALLMQAIDGQMLADVPLGAFLSGGVDSSTVVALMTRLASQPVKTFAIGFAEAGYNEAEHARAVAAHLGTSHTEMYVSAQDALNVVPLLPEIYDEPFADSSQIPTYLVAKLARQHVTVALSGDGGDELFAGYSRYLLAQNVWRHLQRVPVPVRRGTARAVLAVRPNVWDLMARLPMALAPKRWNIQNVGDQVHKFATAVLPAESASGMYRALISHWHDPGAVVNGGREPATLLQDQKVLAPFPHDVERSSLCDQLTYLPDDILVKVDRAAMAVSLEPRVPLLDHRIVEYAWQVPMHQKIRGNETKWLLRQVLYRHVPRQMIERPKQGFAVPLQHWLRGPLRDWGESLLSAQRLAAEGYFDVHQVRRKWEEHQSGVRNWQYPLWDVLMFQAWMDHASRSYSRTRDAA
ncbi:MAG: asparagine synthase (glutamine-hydrolyzing) [Pseudomonadota bacterium]|nr:asparagine synthase (glutamine-hydrolyzing) [Pseudomonadota bacterium]